MKQIKLHIEELREEIASYLTSLQVLVRHRNASKLYDINIHCEEIFCEVLNVVLRGKHPGICLVSANTVSSPNCPGIDLIDAKRKIIVQVTSSCKNDKVKDTFAVIKKANKYSGYVLYFMFIAGASERINLRSNRAPKGVVCKQENLLYPETLVSLLQGDKARCEKLLKVLRDNLGSRNEMVPPSSCFSFITEIAMLCKSVDHVCCMCDEFLQDPNGVKGFGKVLIERINHQISNSIPEAMPNLFQIRQEWALHVPIYGALLQIDDYVSRIDATGRDVAYDLDVQEVSKLTNELLLLIRRIVKMMCVVAGLKEEVAFTELSIRANL